MKILFSTNFKKYTRQAISAVLMTAIGGCLFFATDSYVPVNGSQVSVKTIAREAQEEETVPVSPPSALPRPKKQQELDVYVPGPAVLNLAYSFPEGETDTEDPSKSYGGQIFTRLMRQDESWFAESYSYAEQKPEQVAARLGKSREDVLGKYNPKDRSHDPNDPSTWTINSFHDIRMNVVNGDGEPISVRSNVIDIMSMANVYTYYKGISDRDLFLSYARELWNKSHSFSYSMSDIYYCDGCIDEEDERKRLEEAAALEQANLDAMAAAQAQAQAEAEAQANAAADGPGVDGANGTGGAYGSDGAYGSEGVNGGSGAAGAGDNSASVLIMPTTTDAGRQIADEYMSAAAPVTVPEATAPVTVPETTAPVTMPETTAPVIMPEGTGNPATETSAMPDGTPINMSETGTAASMTVPETAASVPETSSAIIMPGSGDGTGAAEGQGTVISGDQTAGISGDQAAGTAESQGTDTAGSQGSSDSATATGNPSVIIIGANFTETEANGSQSVEAGANGTTGVTGAAGAEAGTGTSVWIGAEVGAETGVESIPAEEATSPVITSGQGQAVSLASPSDSGAGTGTSEGQENETEGRTKCPGHVDLIVNMRIRGLEEDNGLFHIDTTGNSEKNIEEGGWPGWNEETIQAVRQLSSLDWYAEYGLSLSVISFGNPLTQAEINEYLSRLPSNLSSTRKDIIEFALNSVGKVPYYWGGKPSGPNYDGNSFGSLITPDYKGRVLKGLDCSGWINWVYWSVTGHSLPYESTSGLALCGSRVDPEDLQPGDILIRTGEDAHVIMFLEWMPDGQIRCIHEGTSGINNVSVAVRNAYWPYYRKLID